MQWFNLQKLGLDVLLSGGVTMKVVPCDFITEMGSGYNPDGTERRRVMEKRTSLDLLGGMQLCRYLIKTIS